MTNPNIYETSASDKKAPLKYEAGQNKAEAKILKEETNKAINEVKGQVIYDAIYGNKEFTNSPTQFLKMENYEKTDPKDTSDSYVNMNQSFRYIRYNIDGAWALYNQLWKWYEYKKDTPKKVFEHIIAQLKKLWVDRKYENGQRVINNFATDKDFLYGIWLYQSLVQKQMNWTSKKDFRVGPNTLKSFLNNAQITELKVKAEKQESAEDEEVNLNHAFENAKPSTLKGKSIIEQTEKTKTELTEVKEQSKSENKKEIEKTAFENLSTDEKIDYVVNNPQLMEGTGFTLRKLDFKEDGSEIYLNASWSNLGQTKSFDLALKKFLHQKIDGTFNTGITKLIEQFEDGLGKDYWLIRLKKFLEEKSRKGYSQDIEPTIIPHTREEKKKSHIKIVNPEIIPTQEKKDGWFLIPTEINKLEEDFFTQKNEKKRETFRKIGKAYDKLLTTQTWEQKQKIIQILEDKAKISEASFNKSNAEKYLREKEFYASRADDLREKLNKI